MNVYALLLEILRLDNRQLTFNKVAWLMETGYLFGVPRVSVCEGTVQL